MDLIGEIVVGVLAFIGAYLGTKRIKKHLIDNYIEKRVTQAQEVNDAVLSKSRDLISSFEKSYTENKPISENELNKIIENCRELSRTSEDGGKEVSTIAYLLYKTVKDLKPDYKDTEGRSFEGLSLGDVINLVSNSLRLIIYYCTNSAPIPFRTRLKKRSVIKRKLRKYLSDKKFYGLKHQPFGLTLNPNSEVILRYTEIVGKTSSAIYSRNLFLFLQSNIPLAYQMIVRKIYMPLIIDKKTEEDGIFFDNYEMHLVKIKGVKSIGEESGNFVEFYYSNINPVFSFIKGMKIEKFRSEFTNDVFLEKDFELADNYKLQKKLNETIKVKVSLDIAKENYKKNKWALKYKLFKYKIAH